MKLAYLISQYPAISHTFIQREVCLLRKRGFQIEVASINSSGFSTHEGTSTDQDEQARTFYVKEQGAFKGLGAILKCAFSSPLSFAQGCFWTFKLGGLNLRRLLFHGFYLVEAALIGQWMHRKGLQHLHVHFANPASNVALLASKMFSITYSMTVHGPDDFFDVTNGCLKEKIEEAFFVCAISHFTLSQLMRLVSPTQWDKLEIAYLGVDPKRFSPQTRAPIPPLQLLTVGRLAPNKGHRILLSAFHLFLQQGGSAHLHLVGDGSDRSALQDQVELLGLQGAVTFHGALDQDQTLERYAEADLFILSSFAEGLPVALMEAMAKEIPCIATAINGIPELIRNEKEGLLVMPANAEELAEALKRLSQDPALRRKLGLAGRQRINEQFDLGANTAHLANIYTKRLGNINGT